VIGLESLAEEVRRYGVRVQVILPAAVDTPIWQQNGSIPPEQALDPARVADLIAYPVGLPADTVMTNTGDRPVPHQATDPADEATWSNSDSVGPRLVGLCSRTP
jgi:NAD(P)-dependent dehydrogenase (short-subunit alcohol dehydrogenase family)